MKQMKKKLLLGLALGLGLFSGIGQAEELKPLKNSRINIIFIFADDWGYGDLSAHGHKRLKTPNLDKMIEEGTDFQQFNVCSPVCSSSRAAVISGNFPSRHGLHEHLAKPEQNEARGMPNFLDPNIVTMPRLMQEAGYKTAHYGKWHLSSKDGGEGTPVPMDYGYDDTAVFNGGGKQLEDGPAGYKSSAWTGNAVTLAIEFLEKYKDEAPVFINLWPHEGHKAIEPTPEHRKPYLDVKNPQQAFYAVLTDADRHIGRLMTYLKESGLDQNTLVLFSSDNGPEGNNDVVAGGTTGGLKGRKRSLYEGGVKVPFIAYSPNYIPVGVHNKESVIAAVDLLPTFCDIAGIELPEGYETDGEVISDALQGVEYERTKPILHYWQGSSTGVNWPRLSAKTDKWKLYANLDKSTVELYDYKNDWGEKKNLAKQYPEIVNELYEQAQAYYKSLDLKKNDKKAAARAKKEVQKEKKVTNKEKAKIRAKAEKAEELKYDAGDEEDEEEDSE